MVDASGCLRIGDRLTGDQARGQDFARGLPGREVCGVLGIFNAKKVIDAMLQAFLCTTKFYFMIL